MCTGKVMYKRTRGTDDARLRGGPRRQRPFHTVLVKTPQPLPDSPYTATLARSQLSKFVSFYFVVFTLSVRREDGCR